jgi:hypothetical protein
MRQDLPLGLEARLNVAREGAAGYDLDRDLLLELGVGAFGQEYLSHAANAEGAQQPIGTYA